MISNKIIGGLLVLILAYYLSNKSCCFKKDKDKLIVETKWGSLNGTISLSRDGREFYEWLGIPYAKSPVGDLRFASPQPLDGKWEGVRNANTYPSPCAQIDIFKGNIIGEEDCLYLNVHAPKLEDTKKLLPVMFFIHGGFFMSGSAQTYKPHYFMDEDVIVITSNYRVGALGFLSTGDSVVRGNMGLKDQSLALKWINENIIYFGGDPNRITIFGESAGAKGIHFQMLSPMSEGLMHRAIAGSGSALNLWTVQDDPVGQGKDFAEKVNCPVSSSEEMVNCLRQVDVKTMQEVHQNSMKLPRTKYTMFAPTVETVLDSEAFLFDQPINIINSGKMAKIPWLVGFNADEGLVYTPAILLSTEYRKRLEKNWKMVVDSILYLSESEKKSSDKIKNFYFGSGENLDLIKQFKSLTNLLTDRWYSHGIYKAAVTQANYAPVQFYYYNKTGPSIFDVMMKSEGKSNSSYGVSHGDNLAMLFFEAVGIFKVSKDDPNYEFSKDLVKSWVSFASVSNTDNAEFRGVKFPRVESKKEVNVIELNDEPRIIQFPILDRMELWDSVEE